MSDYISRSIIAAWVFFFIPVFIVAQEKLDIQFSSNGNAIIKVNGREVNKETPLFSCRFGDQTFNNMLDINSDNIPRDIAIILEPKEFDKGYKSLVTLFNHGQDTIALDNFLPFGRDDNRVYITGKGNHYLSRTHLFRPGFAPVNVILPDNLWNLGFSAGEIASDVYLTGLMRRKEIIDGQRRRFETILFPGGSVSYELYIEKYEGDWYRGLKRVFQERYLYDVENFDDSLYERDDLHGLGKVMLCIS